MSDVQQTVTMQRVKEKLAKETDRFKKAANASRDAVQLDRCTCGQDEQGGHGASERGGSRLEADASENSCRRRYVT